ncbi:nitrile hydratase accessory protein [Neorhizobium galegae]|uniref:nitrile hydratase accessory protein n=1 Tax=Neorhizobium galegae TaxID=399 RepID=UPI001AE1D376|nr:nitrile hydratase accessory protein [Neorhizobium galegae]MBP2549169.1 nitrile hydratase accessory protein [Neorhizobium galegae]
MSQCETVSPLAGSPGLPVSSEGAPVFAEPWQAKAFALTVHLYERGVFSWAEWAEHLSREVKRPERAADGADYFDAWVAALSHLLAEKGVAEEGQVLALQHSWQRAAEATPHGSPIVLSNDPQHLPDAGRRGGV